MRKSPEHGSYRAHGQRVSLELLDALRQAWSSTWKQSSRQQQQQQHVLDSSIAWARCQIKLEEVLEPQHANAASTHQGDFYRLAVQRLAIYVDGLRRSEAAIGKGADYLGGRVAAD
eukprot:6464281-Amphidinium_carterae.2